MKRILYLILAIALLISAVPLAGEAASDPITALETNYMNVLFSNGYRGFCLDRALHGATYGNVFTAADTSVATSNYDGRSLGQELKILFTQNFDTLFAADGNGSYALTNPNNVQAAIWNLTDNQYIWGEQKTLVNSIQSYTGPAIPDDGYQLTLANGDIVTFSFMVLQPDNESVQDFFAYKITVGQEPPHQHTPESGWQSDSTQHWQECECGTVIDGSAEPHVSNNPENQASCEKQAVCDECGESYGETPSHAYTKEEIKDSALKAPGDCDQEAVYIKSCEHCGEVDPDTTNTFLGEKDADNHADHGTYLDGEAEPDHKNQVDGYTGDEKCSGCDEIVTPGQAIPVDPHVPESGWSGNDTHHWKECTVPGCGTVIEGTSTLHTSENPENQASCEKQAVCDECGESYGETPSHAYTKEEIKDSALKTPGDCNQEAVYIKSCEHCGEVDPDTTNTFLGEKDANNHADYGTYLYGPDLPDHNNQTDGYTGDEKCNGCDEIITPGQTIPVDPHVPESGWSGDDTHHWKECTVPGCGTVIEGTSTPHTSENPENQPACEKQAVCDECGESYGETPTHDYGEEIPEDPAEIGKEGVKAHYQCSECHKYFVDAGQDKQEVAYSDLIIPALLPPPTEPTAAPTEPTVAPTEPTAAPTEPTAAPTEPTAAPTEPTAAPTEPTVAPTEPTAAPTEPTAAPTEPTAAPTEPTDAPTEPTDAPTEPTDAPTEPTVAPTEPTVAPTEPTAAPTEPTDTSTQPVTSPSGSEITTPNDGTDEPTTSPDDSDSELPPETGDIFSFALCIAIGLLGVLGCFVLCLTNKKNRKFI